MEDKGTKPIATDTDRISGLPQPIIHRILSFLPPKDVTRTNSLSKTWYNMTMLFPALDFDGSRYERQLYQNIHDDDFMDKHLNYFGRRLQRFRELNVKIRRLTITLTLPELAPRLDSLITLALQQGVEEFSLKNYYSNLGENWYHDLPQSVLAAKSVRVAKFEGCNLWDSFLPRDRSSSNNLQKLFLDHVRLDDQTLSCIISSCPLIEELSLVSCSGIHCFQISNLHNLKTLRVSYLSGDAGDRNSIEIGVQGTIKLSILELPNLRDLYLHCVDLENLQLHDFLSRLSLLRSLCLSDLYLLKNLKVSSHTLEKLKITSCSRLVELEIECPNLLLARYDGQLPTLLSTEHNVTGPWSVSTSYGCSRSSHSIEEFLVDLRNFVSNAKHFEYLCLNFHDEFPSLSIEELNERAVQFQPIPNIDHLELSISHGTKISCPDLFDGVLWSCHPRTLSLQLGHDHHYCNVGNNNVAKRICKVIASHRHCWSCTLARRWLHHLVDITFVATDGSEYQCPIMGKNSKPYLKSSYTEIKFNFRW